MIATTAGIIAIVVQMLCGSPAPTNTSVAKQPTNIVVTDQNIVY